MKASALTLATFLVFTTAGFSQQWQPLVVKNADGAKTITVPTGNFVEFLSPNYAGNINIALDFGGARLSDSTANAINYVTQDKKYSGPISIIITATSSNSFASVPYRIVDPASTSLLPSNAVVIPANSTGPVTIILESSIDLVTWNAATPGTYGSGTAQRFFRVRAVTAQ